MLVSSMLSFFSYHGSVQSGWSNYVGSAVPSDGIIQVLSINLSCMPLMAAFGIVDMPEGWVCLKFVRKLT